ncbi:MAG: hypothetical protein RJA81_1297 [Planctomycetota bacterium]
MESDIRSKQPIQLIKAQKSGWQRFWIRKMIQYKVRTSFHSCLGQGLENLRTAYTDHPETGVLAVANHSNWWDFLFGLWLNEFLKVDGYGMTEHANMVKYGFFRRVGIYSMERSDPASTRASLDYTVELLQRPGSLVWMMPQGRILCNDIRPLDFQDGLRLLARRARRLVMIPLALRYEFWQDEKPEACVRFGVHEVVEWSKQSANSLVDHWQNRVTEELDILRIDTLSQDLSRFETLQRGPRSINERMEGISKFAD